MTTPPTRPTRHWITARDYTAVRNRETRVWDIGGISIPGGISTTMLVAGFGGFAAVALILATLFDAVSASYGWYIAGFVAAATTGFFAARMSRKSDGSLTAAQFVVAWADWVFRQPRRIQGSQRDREPDLLRWQVIAWEPGDTDWWASYYAFHDHYTSRDN